jgi:dTDP-4-dehydrorhamnose reductase
MSGQFCTTLYHRSLPQRSWFFTALILSFWTALASAQQDATASFNEARAMCDGLTEENKSMAAAAGYDIGKLCRSVDLMGSSSNKDADQAELLVLPRGAEIKNQPTSNFDDDPKDSTELASKRALEEQHAAGGRLQKIEVDGLKPFGYELFAGEPTTFEPASRIPVSPDYNLVSNKCRFHHISTDEVFGSLENHGPAFSETTAYAPNSPYSATKAGSDYLVRAWHRTYGLPVTISHCSNNYGPYQHSEKFIPTVVSACLNQTDIPVYGDGTNIRDWLYVEDHCSAVDTLVRRGIVGQAYNIGGLNEWSNIHICQLICDLMDQQLPSNAPHRRLIQFVADRPGHDWPYAIDASKIVEQLGWSPQQTFQTGITATLDWMMQAR